MSELYPILTDYCLESLGIRERLDAQIMEWRRKRHDWYTCSLDKGEVFNLMIRQLDALIEDREL